MLELGALLFLICHQVLDSPHAELAHSLPCAALLHGGCHLPRDTLKAHGGCVYSKTCHQSSQRFLSNSAPCIGSDTSTQLVTRLKGKPARLSWLRCHAFDASTQQSNVANVFCAMGMMAWPPG